MQSHKHMRIIGDHSNHGDHPCAHRSLCSHCSQPSPSLGALAPLPHPSMEAQSKRLTLGLPTLALSSVESSPAESRYIAPLIISAAPRRRGRCAPRGRSGNASGSHGSRTRALTAQSIGSKSAQSTATRLGPGLALTTHSAAAPPVPTTRRRNTASNRDASLTTTVKSLLAAASESASNSRRHGGHPWH